MRRRDSIGVSLPTLDRYFQRANAFAPPAALPLHLNRCVSRQHPSVRSQVYRVGMSTRNAASLKTTSGCRINDRFADGSVYQVLFPLATAVREIGFDSTEQLVSVVHQDAVRVYQMSEIHAFVEKEKGARGRLLHPHAPQPPHTFNSELAENEEETFVAPAVHLSLPHMGQLHDANSRWKLSSAVFTADSVYTNVAMCFGCRNLWIVDLETVDEANPRPLCHMVFPKSVDVLEKVIAGRTHRDVFCSSRSGNIYRVDFRAKESLAATFGEQERLGSTLPTFAPGAGRRQQTRAKPSVGSMCLIGEFYLAAGNSDGCILLYDCRSIAEPVSAVSVAAAASEFELCDVQHQQSGKQQVGGETALIGSISHIRASEMDNELIWFSATGGTFGLLDLRASSIVLGTHQADSDRTSATVHAPPAQFAVMEKDSIAWCPRIATSSVSVFQCHNGFRTTKCGGKLFVSSTNRAVGQKHARSGGGGEEDVGCKWINSLEFESPVSACAAPRSAGLFFCGNPLGAVDVF